MTATTDHRAARIAGMRALADLLQANPALPLPMDSTGTRIYIDPICDPHAQLAALEAVLTDQAVTIEDKDKDFGFQLTGRLHGQRVTVIAHPKDVCDRRTHMAEVAEFYPCKPDIFAATYEAVAE